jgi:hypothetical protein
MYMKLIDSKITISDLEVMARNGFGNLVKAVVDIQKEVMVVDGSLHADEEALLLSQGSKQSDLWGINLYPELAGDDFIEFDSMINLRPSQGNMSRSVDNLQIQKKIRIIVSKLIK